MDIYLVSAVNDAGGIYPDAVFDDPAEANDYIARSEDRIGAMLYDGTAIAGFQVRVFKLRRKS